MDVSGRRVRSQAGVTLIESMIAIAITATVGGMAALIGQDYTDQASRREARDQLMMGYHKARSIAMRNVSALTPGAASTLYCLGPDHVLRVFARDDTTTPATALPTACESTSGTPIWSAAVAGGTRTQIQRPGVTPAEAWDCMAIDRAGERIAHSIGTTTCTTNATVVLNRGNRSLTMSWLNGQ